MPTKRTIDVYKFDELTGKARTRALDEARQYLSENFDADMLTDFFKERLDELGLPSKKISWSLGYVQSDGVGFHGRIDLKDYLTKNKLKTKYAELLQDNIDITVDLEGRDNHTGRVECEVRGNPTPKQENLVDELSSEIKEHAYQVARELEKAGYADIEYQTSEPQVIEFLESNDYDFDVNGDII